MQLVRPRWDEDAVLEYENYLLSLSKGEEKGEWERRIVNTALPCIAVPSEEVRRIAAEISKGDYKSFLAIAPYNNYSEVAVIANIISRIKDYDEFVTALDRYGKAADCWASVDTLKFNGKRFGEKLFRLGDDYIHRPLTFERRIGLRIMFSFIDAEHIDYIFKTAEELVGEKEYYVNMCLAWLLAECVVKRRDDAVAFLRRAEISDFVLSKTVSKCRDSFRVSNEDKDMLKKLLKYKLCRE